MKKILFLFLFFLLFSSTALAQEKREIDITPTIIDEKGMASEIFDYTVKLTNNTNTLKNVYAFVNDQSVEEGYQEFTSPGQMDKTISLARWINIQRSVVDIKPGESVELPLKIQINQYAKPGKYYAKIVFGNGPNRPKAEENALSVNAPEIIINVSVEELIIEKSQIQQFNSTKNVYLKKPVIFNFEIENFGNRNIIPTGSVYIYNRRGQEIDKLVFNESAEQIMPEEKKMFELAWENVRGFGKFKARAELEYGEQTKRDLQDSINFWVLPLPILIGFVAGLLLLVVILSIIIHKKTFQIHKYHQNNNSSGDGVIDLKK